MFTTKYRYLFIVILAVYSYLNTLFSEVYKYYNINADWYDVLLVFLIITFLIWEGNRFIQKALKNFFTDNSGLRSLVIFFITGVVFSSLIAVAVVYITGAVFLKMPAEQLSIAAKLAFTYATRINLFLHIFNAILVYINQYKNKELEAEELKRINTQAQLQAIKNQVNPHFLFNNLNVLSSLVMQENPDANKFIEEFAKVYRHVLNSQQQELIELRSELEFIKPYIFLLEKRFPESIFIDINVPLQYESYYIIPVALQMLVENAIKHNIASKAKPLYINITIEANNMLCVTNNLQVKFADEQSTQLGLKNIAQRYEIIANKKIEIVKSENKFSVLVPLIQPGA